MVFVLFFDCNSFIRWFNRKPPRDEPEVPIPPLKDDEWHSMTVLPYLEDHYYDDSTEDASNVQFYTEHQLNGMISICTYSFVLLSLFCLIKQFLYT